MTDREHDGQWAPLRRIIDTAPAGTTLSVAVRHLHSGAAFAHLGDRRVPAASTIKLLILIAVARAIDAGTLDRSTRIASGPDTRVAGSGVLNWLSSDLELTIEDHAWLMIAISDNTASNVLIDAVGLAAIREAARDLALTTTELHLPFMSTRRRPDDPSNSVSADDLVRLLDVIATGRAASAGQSAWVRSLLGDQQYREGIPRHLPSGVQYAGKTGWQTGIVHDCGLLTGPGGTVALAVLTEGYADPYCAHMMMGEIGELVARTVT